MTLLQYAPILLVLLLIVAGAMWGRYRENKEWNNGACTKCQTGFWKSFDVDSSGAVGYKCVNENCRTVTWQSWHGRGAWY